MPPKSNDFYMDSEAPQRIAHHLRAMDWVARHEYWARYKASIGRMTVKLHKCLVLNVEAQMSSTELLDGKCTSTKVGRGLVIPLHDINHNRKRQTTLDEFFHPLNNDSVLVPTKRMRQTSLAEFWGRR